jgi:hypothetical protein
MGVMKKGPSINGLAVAFYLSADAHRLNVYDVGLAVAKVMGGTGDHKLNVVNQRLVPDGLAKLVPAMNRPYLNGVHPGKTAKVYVIQPYGRGLRMVTAAFEANKMNVPKRWLDASAAKPAQPVKGETAGKVPATA